MLASNGRGAFALGIVLTVLCASVYAQQKIYKWVDENGVVHFSEELATVPPGVKAEVISTDPAPSQPPVPRARTTVKSAPPAKTQVESQPIQPVPEIPPLSTPVDITKMSLDELDRRCEEAREAMIAPLRAAEIEECIHTGAGDRAWCESFWADYGAPSRTASGDLIPGMFYDLRECTEAWEERNRRGLYPE
jgi:hypothetical protein